MPPPRFTNPPPKTESARSAVKSFFCDLCQKGYQRMNEWEAHEGSYDHQHKKRLKELSRMQRDPNATNKARERERKEDERSGMAGLSFKPVKLGGGGGEEGGQNTGLSKGFKKGGFKSAFGDGGVAVVPDAKGEDGEEVRKAEEDGEVESDSDEELYDPRRPTGCGDGCSGRI